MATRTGRKRTKKLITRLMGIALAVTALVCALVTAGGVYFLRTAYTRSERETLTTAAVQLADRLEAISGGDWSSESGRVKKGGEPADNSILDALKESTGLDYSLWLNRHRELTTIKDADGYTRAAGSDADDDIYSGVITAGGIYMGEDVISGLGTQTAVFVPVRNSDGTIVGMAEASRDAGIVFFRVITGTIVMIAASACFFALAAVLMVIMAKKATAQMGGVATMLKGLSGGSLKYTVDGQAVRRRDEIGEIAEGAKQLDEKLGRVIKSTREVSKGLYDSGLDLADSAYLAADATGHVADKIEEINKGTVSQAESVRRAAADAGGLDIGLDAVSSEAGELSDYAQEIAACLERLTALMARIAEESANTAAAVREADEAIRSADDAAKSITAFSQTIAGIASQTNLLSLNASIEASRAGEAGRGFAVVAEEIRQLADESKSSAEEIKGIVERLNASSATGLEAVSRLTGDAENRTARLSEAASDMRFMTDSVARMKEGTERVALRIEALGETRSSLNGVIEDLSVLSEQNAAFSEETTASMQELHTTFTVISESAEQLKYLADDLKETMSFFRE